MEPQDFAAVVRRLERIGEDESKRREHDVIVACQERGERAMQVPGLAVHRSRAERRHLFAPGGCVTNATPNMSDGGREDYYRDERLNLARISTQMTAGSLRSRSR